jgi:pSer/pThr/pTyr-binding forkhead associated (FHA) protein
MLTMEDIERIHHKVSTKRQPQLHWEIAGQQGTFYIKTDTVRVGRSAECELRLPIGPAHALVVARGSRGFDVRRDTGWLSLTPLRVNGRLARQTTLKNGDRIELGDLRVTFLDEI